MAEGKSEISFSVEQLAPRDEVRRQLPRFRSQPRLYAKELARLQNLYQEVTIVPDDLELAEQGRQHHFKSTFQRKSRGMGSRHLRFRATPLCWN